MFGSDTLNFPNASNLYSWLLSNEFNELLSGVNVSVDKRVDIIIGVLHDVITNL